VSNGITLLRTCSLCHLPCATCPEPRDLTIVFRDPEENWRARSIQRLKHGAMQLHPLNATFARSFEKDWQELVKNPQQNEAQLNKSAQALKEAHTFLRWRVQADSEASDWFNTVATNASSFATIGEWLCWALIFASLAKVDNVRASYLLQHLVLKKNFVYLLQPTTSRTFINRRASYVIIPM